VKGTQVNKRREFFLHLNFPLLAKKGDYEEKFPFNPTISGEYTLTLTVLTGHIKDVYIAVSQKSE